MNEKIIQEYFKQSIRLVKSCVFKIDENYVNYSFHNYVKFNRRPPKRIDSKYYTNLAGLKTEFDPDVLVLSPILGEYIPLTRNVLKSDPLLREIIEKFGEDYNAVIDKYPTMKTYVDGCLILRDYTISDLVNRIKNYSLLYINKDFLNTYEINIVKDIEHYVENFFSRWFNRGYMLDEYYLPGFLNNLYQGLVLYVLFVKLKNVFTYSVDDFHLTNFLASYKNLDKYVTIFDRDTKLWLYGNLRRLKRYLGHDKTLEELLQKVWERNKYGIGELIYHNKKSEINNFGFENKNVDLSFYKRDYTYTAEKRNESFFELDGNNYDVYEVNNMLKDNKTIPDFYRLNDRYADFMSKLENITESYTKNFILDRPEKIKNFSINRIVTVISNLLHILRSENYQLNNFDYVNRINGKIYKLTAKDIFNLIVYGIYKIVGGVNENFTFITYGVFEYPNKNKALQQTWHKEMLSDIFDFLLPDILKVKTFKNYDLIRRWMSEVKEIEPKTWYLVSNITDNTIRTDIISITNQCFKTDLISVDINKIKQELEDREILDFYKFEEKIYETLIYFLEALSGIDLEPYKKILELYGLTKGFFARTTSYSIILLTDYNFKDVVISNNLKNSINLGYKPMIEAKKGKWERHEFWPADMYASNYYQNLEYARNHTSNITSTVMDLTNFMYYRTDEILDKNKKALAYVRRYPGRKYKVQTDSVVFEDQLPRLEQGTKSIDIDIIDKPKINTMTLPSIVNDGKLMNVYRLGKYTKEYVIPNKIPYSVDIEETIDKLKSHKPTITSVGEKSEQPIITTNLDNIAFNNITIKPTLGYPVIYKSESNNESVITQLDTYSTNITDRKANISTRKIEKQPTLKFNNIPITDNNDKLLTDYPAKYTKNYVVENRQPTSLDTESDTIREFKTNKISKIVQDSDLHVNSKTDYITDELDPWNNPAGYPKPITIDLNEKAIENDKIDADTRIESSKVNISSRYVKEQPELNVSKPEIDINKFMKSDFDAKYTKPIVIDSKKGISLVNVSDTIEQYDKTRFSKVYQESNLHVNSKTDYITDELDPWNTESGYPIEVSYKIYNTKLPENIIKEEQDYRPNLNSEKIEDQPTLSFSQPVDDINKTMKTNNDAKYTKPIVIDSNEGVSLNTESDVIGKYDKNKIRKVYQEGSAKVSIKPEYITDELDPWYNDIGYPKEEKYNAVTDAIVTGYIEESDPYETNMSSYKIDDKPTLKLSQPTVDINTFLNTNNDAKYFQHLQPEMKEITFVPQSEEDIEKVKKMKKYYSIGTNTNSEVLISNVDEVNEYQAFVIPSGYSKQYSIEQNNTTTNNNIDNINNQDNTSSTKTIDNINTNAKTDDVENN